jgi:hypothetical protein
MATINEIQNFLNIELNNRVMINGRKVFNKNKYYYYENLYYIVELTNDKYMICSDDEKTRQLLSDYCWRLSTKDNYSKTSIDNTTKYYHQLLLNYEDGLVCDHKNRHRYDNRINNLRIVTVRENNRNRNRRKTNTSGKNGVHYVRINRLHYWKAVITNNDGNIVTKMFNINILGDAEAKRRAIEQRQAWEVLYGYTGE